MADTTYLQYCQLIGRIDLLPQLYATILVPEAVARELAVGRKAIPSLPDPASLAWCQVTQVAVAPAIAALDLGEGEKEVLNLASDHEFLALLDDSGARREARRIGVRFTGILGILLRAKREGILEMLRPCVNDLMASGFWLDSRTRRQLLDLAGE